MILPSPPIATAVIATAAGVGPCWPCPWRGLGKWIRGGVRRRHLWAGSRSYWPARAVAPQPLRSDMYMYVQIQIYSAAACTGQIYMCRAICGIHVRKSYSRITAHVYLFRSAAAPPKWSPPTRLVPRGAPAPPAPCLGRARNRAALPRVPAAPVRAAAPGRT